MRGVQLQLFVVIFYSDLLEIFGFEDLPAIETLDVIDAIAARDDLRTGVFTSEFHNQDRIYSNEAGSVVKCPRQASPRGKVWAIQS